MPKPSEGEKLFDSMVKSFVAKMGPSDKLGVEDLTKMLKGICSIEKLVFGTNRLSEQYHKIEHCQTVIGDINGLEDTLRDAHKKSSYYSICSIGECSPISQSANLTPCTRGTMSTAG